MRFPEESMRELTALGEIVLACEDLVSAQNEICRIAVRVIPGADGASLTAISERGAEAVAASGDWSRSLDELQYEEHEGPCLDASRSGLVFRVRDTTADPRWPSYLPRAAKVGARSIMSLPMTVEAKVIGALNVYSKEVDKFDAEDVSIGEIVAGYSSLASSVAGSLFQHKSLADQLREAMVSRAVIEQAKGVIMTTTRCDADTAFKILVEQSQQENRKVREVAAEIVRQQSR
jgi:GAF domain-containing protein